MNPIKISLQAFVFCLWLAPISQLIGQETMFQVFQSTPNLNLTITCEWDTLQVQRDDTEIDAITSFNDQPWSTQLRLRGHFRRMSCDKTTLPFRLQFNKKELKKEGLKKFRNHKIVTTCLDDKEGEENLQQEILIYQLYEILTDQSFRTVEAELTTQWPENKKTAITRPVFIIEPNKELGDRLGGTEVETYNYPADSLDSESYNRVALFEFMIGNYDWNQPFQHNVKTFRIDSVAILVPYDFDFSAIVAPTYARIPRDIGLSNYRDRIYYGQFFLDELPKTEAYFISKKNELYEHIYNFEGLKKARIKKIIQYFDLFYTFIEDPNHVLTYKTILFFEQ